MKRHMCVITFSSAKQTYNYYAGGCLHDKCEEVMGRFTIRRMQPQQKRSP